MTLLDKLQALQASPECSCGEQQRSYELDLGEFGLPCKNDCSRVRHNKLASLAPHIPKLVEIAGSCASYPTEGGIRTCLSAGSHALPMCNRCTVLKELEEALDA